MGMAENAAKLISENLHYPDGTPVQCVIGCTTIGGGTEAAKVAEQFSTQNDDNDAHNRHPCSEEIQESLVFYR